MSIRRISITIITLSLVALLGCIGAAVFGVALFVPVEVNTDVSVPQPIIETNGATVSNHIAYIGNDNNIYVVDAAGGSEPNPLTGGDAGYHFPTWSPDGRYVAFIGPHLGRNPALYISPATESRPTIIFSERAAPFYLYWSPDSRQISFLTSEMGGMAMRVVDVDGNADRVVSRGAPFYWMWAPDGSKMLLHVNGSRRVSAEAHISIIDNNPDAERVELDLAPGRFQSPVWTSDGAAFFSSATDEDGQEHLFKTDLATLEQTVVTRLGGLSYLVLSPDDRHLAYIEVQSGMRPPFGMAYLVDTETGDTTQLYDGVAGSLFWSPDGSKLALLTLIRQQEGSTAQAGMLASPLAQAVYFRWLIYDPATAEIDTLVTYVPTLDFLQIIPYFDQYHLSLSFWSPDSRAMVVTRGNYEEDMGEVWIYDTTGVEEPRQIGEGTLAVWSWQ